MQIAELEQVIGLLTLELAAAKRPQNDWTHCRELVREKYPVRVLCRVLEMVSSTYYYRGAVRDGLSLLAAVEEVLRRFPTYGYRRVTAQLQQEELRVNHNRVHRVMEGERPAGGM